MLETPIYSYEDACIFDANAMFHTGLLHHHDGKSSPPAAISQPEIYTNALAAGGSAPDPAVTAYSAPLAPHS